MVDYAETTMASSSGYNGAEGAAQSISRKLHATDLPSKCLLGKGLASIVYESEWKGLRCARKDFIGVRSDIFEAEARDLARLEHDNIVKTHGWTVDKMSCSLVEEYVEDDLLDLLQHRKKSQGSLAGTGLELREALQVMSQTARAMEYLHGQGIIHGDLKTNNILVTQVNGGGKNSLLVKVADFGLTQTKRKSIPFVSRPVRKLDMVQWKAPEYFMRPVSDASEDNDESSESDSSSNEVCTSGSLDLKNDRFRFQAACDKYSFAVTCYQVLTGKKPYPNWNWKVLGAKIVQDNLRPKLPDSCPIMLRDLLEQCWYKDPIKRPAFTNICSALEEIQLKISESIYHPNPTTVVLNDLNIDAIANRSPTIAAASLSKNFNLEIKDESHDGHEIPTVPTIDRRSDMGSQNSTKVVEQLNSSVYLLHEPDQLPQVELVFIHGLQHGDFKEAYRKTWLARDGSDSNCWPSSWLPQRIPRARILSLSYDSSDLKSLDKENLDRYAVARNLLRAMVMKGSRIGQNGCPVIFVCHSLGGLVAKQIAVHATRMRSDEVHERLLQNTKGFFFYATPHFGSKLADLADKILTHIPGVEKGAVVENLTVLNKDSAVLNGKFDDIRRARTWALSNIGESHKTKIAGWMFSKMVVPKSSARLPGVPFLTVDEDHMNVCKPESCTATSFVALVDFVKRTCDSLGNQQPLQLEAILT